MAAELSQPLLGESEVMLKLIKRLPAVVKARRTTLISGPTGCGKEVLASTLHRKAHGTRAPYVPVHCGALPEHLVEAELFGHTKGAFTGATHARTGLIKSAANGTLFLDEIDSLSQAVQTKLLRFLEAGEYRPVGSDRIEKADKTWVLAATNRDLKEEVKEKRFREDLLYRLDIIHLKLPALRLRGGDIEMLARRFLTTSGGDNYRFTSDALRALHRHDWPGNVRELKHRIDRAVLLAQDTMINAADLELSEVLEQKSSSHNPQNQKLEDLWKLVERDGLSLAEAIAHCERMLITAALNAENNNRTRAAQRLGIHVRTIFKKLNR